jgi:inosose dehydratase
MRSIYVGSTLHTREDADKSIANTVAIARAAKAIGTRIIVTNPNPLQWGGPQNKDDQQLRTQAESLDRLGRELAALGITLAYHNHDIELRNAAREFHHMMNGTDPRHVSLCLDAHWVYRGSGNSQVALFDVVKLYGARVAEVHLRQSEKGVWSETLGPGDIDYEAFAASLLKARSHHPKPHLVMEIAVENGTPKTVGPGEAHRRSVDYARRIFAGFAG